MDILVLGHTGTLGRYMASYLHKSHNVTTVDKNKLNALTVSVQDLLEAVKHQDVVVNCIGMLKKQQKEDNVSVGDYMSINGVFPTALSVACDYTNTKLIGFSSDCIYTGNSGPYSESRLPDAVDPYGIAKSKEPLHCSVIRTSFIGEEIPGKERGLLEWVKSQRGGNIDGYTNCKWNGVTALFLAQTVCWILNNNAFFKCTKHVHSLPNIGMTKYELCKKINDMYDLGISINPVEGSNISGSDINGVLDRRLLSSCPDVDIPQREFDKQLYELKSYTF